ncbi:MAG: hypothetical protein WD734_02705 [Dehalococcoidia bacterium]
MSTYQVEKLCYRAVHDLPFRDALSGDPDGTLAALPLTDEERDLLRRGEVGRLYEQGAHPYLLSHIASLGLFGVTRDSYRERMRALLE